MPRLGSRVRIPSPAQRLKSHAALVAASFFTDILICLGGGTRLPEGRPAYRRQVGKTRRTLDNMFFVYAIKSESRNYIYVGLTDNLERRLSEHNNGRNRTTKPYKPFVLIHSEVFKTRVEARGREKYLKSGIGKDFLKSL